MLMAPVGNGVDRLDGALLAEAHDRALAELLLDLADGQFDGLEPFAVLAVVSVAHSVNLRHGAPVRLRSGDVGRLRKRGYSRVVPGESQAANLCNVHVRTRIMNQSLTGQRHFRLSVAAIAESAIIGPECRAQLATRSPDCAVVGWRKRLRRPCRRPRRPAGASTIGRNSPSMRCAASAAPCLTLDLAVPAIAHRTVDPQRRRRRSS